MTEIITGQHYLDRRNSAGILPQCSHITAVKHRFPFGRLTEMGPSSAQPIFGKLRNEQICIAHYRNRFFCICGVKSPFLRSFFRLCLNQLGWRPCHPGRAIRTPPVASLALAGNSPSESPLRTTVEFFRRGASRCARFFVANLTALWYDK